jgi:hypothetical protein
MNLAIVCGSAPALKPLVVRITPQFQSRFGYGSSGTRDTLPNYKNKSDHRSFIELKGKSSQELRDLEPVSPGGRRDITALPVLGKERKGEYGDIAVTREVDVTTHSYEKSLPPSGNSSQDELGRGYGFR